MWHITAKTDAQPMTAGLNFVSLCSCKQASHSDMWNINNGRQINAHYSGKKKLKKTSQHWEPSVKLCCLFHYIFSPLPIHSLVCVTVWGCCQVDLHDVLELRIIAAVLESRVVMVTAEHVGLVVGEARAMEAEVVPPLMVSVWLAHPKMCWKSYRRQHMLALSHYHHTNYITHLHTVARSCLSVHDLCHINVLTHLCSSII